jgi:hypothetical protein
MNLIAEQRGSFLALRHHLLKTWDLSIEDESVDQIDKPYIPIPPLKGVNDPWILWIPLKQGNNVVIKPLKAEEIVV